MARVVKAKGRNRRSRGFHPLCLLFPRLGDEELQELAADIRQNGLQNDIITLTGKILDGRNRYEACRIAGVEPRFKEFDGDDPATWVVSQNLVRRHLAASQRAVVAFGLLPILQAEATKRQRLSKGRGKKVAKELATFSANGKSSQAAARIAKTNSAYVEAVTAINRKAPELLDEIRSGRLTVPEASELAKLPKRQRTSVLRRAANSNGKLSKVIRQAELEAGIYPLEKVEGEDGKWYPAGGGHGRPFFPGCNTPNPKQNDISTPPGICRFLFDLIRPKYRPRVILDPCAGSGNLTRPWRGKAKTVSFEIKRGKDFFTRAKPLDEVGLVLCNPPFNGNPDSKELFPSRFLYHILELVPHDTPIVFFAPFGFLLNARSGTQIYAGRTNRYAWLRDDCPPITSIIPLPQDAFVPSGKEGPLVHSQILMFNMDRLEPCNFVPDEYLA